jgi:2-polyprenyl-6-methoxyphenol hydroxylase-like FAD-dependent oxidoreductase
MLLAGAGHDVVLVDRAGLPSDTTSTHALVRGGVVQLKRWGLLDAVHASGAPEIRSAAFHRYDAAAPAPVHLTIKGKAGVDHVLAPRRHVLDDILARAAVRAGAQLLDRTRVRELLRDGHGRVTGVLAVDPLGRRLELSAQWVVGADGVRSRVADLVGAPVLEQHPPSGSCFYTYVGGVGWDGFEFHVGEGVFAGVFPTHDDAACVWLMQPREASAPIRAAGGRRTHAWLGELRRGVPRLAERVAAGTVRDRLRGSMGLPNQLRHPHGAGWALVGDAGYHRDPITSHGITDAFRDAELLAGALDVALRVPSEEAPALASYREQRAAAVTETFRLTRALGAFPAPEVFAALQVELSRALDIEAESLAARPIPRSAATTAAG